MQLSTLLPLVGLLAAISGADASNPHRGGAVARRAHNTPRTSGHNALNALAAKRAALKKCRVRPTPGTAGSAAGSAANSGSSNSSAPATGSGSGSGSGSDSSNSAPAQNSAASSAASNPPAASSDSAAPTGGNLVAEPTSSAVSNAAPSGGYGGGLPPSSGTIANGIKAGVSSGDGLSQFAPHIGWWYDWNPVASSNAAPNAVYVPMLWGSGGLGGDQDDSNRLAQFKTIAQAQPFIMGFEEPDCSTPGSAAMSVETTISLWNELIAPHKASGSLLLSPSWCKQIAETYMKPFTAGIHTQYDITNIHINKNSMDGVRASLDHYAQYGKPIWVTEFACVDDSSAFVPCTDEGQITQFIYDIVDLLQNDDRVHGYAFSNGMGLGDKWRLTQPDGQTLTAAGQAYLNAISKYA